MAIPPELLASCMTPEAEGRRGYICPTNVNHHLHHLHLHHLLSWGFWHILGIKMIKPEYHFIILIVVVLVLVVFMVVAHVYHLITAYEVPFSLLVDRSHSGIIWFILTD